VLVLLALAGHQVLVVPLVLVELLVPVLLVVIWVVLILERILLVVESQPWDPNPPSTP
jgi:hypothetical protein